MAVQDMFGATHVAQETATDGDRRITCHTPKGVTGARLVALVQGGRDGLPYVDTYDAKALPFGVAKRDAPAGERVGVIGLGNVPKVETGAAVKGGDPLKGDTQGRVVPATLGTDPAHLIVGIAGHDAASGETVQVHRAL